MCTDTKQFPLPDNLFDSKDWRAADYAGRVEWLVVMYQSQREEIKRLTSDAPTYNSHKDQS